MLLLLQGLERVSVYALALLFLDVEMAADLAELVGNVREVAHQDDLQLRDEGAC